MYYWRIFLWENGKKSTEYTDYCLAPIYYEDKLDETLDTGEIVLEKMPIETKKAFPPKTKFRLERFLNSDYSDEPTTFDVIVDHDDVEEHIGCDEICTHRIHFIEVSAIAQGIHIDNFALTYELQDVDLNYKTTHSSSEKAIYNVSANQPGVAAIRQTDSFNSILNGSGGNVAM